MVVVSTGGRESLGGEAGASCSRHRMASLEAIQPPRLCLVCGLQAEQLLLAADPAPLELL